MCCDIRMKISIIGHMRRIYAFFFLILFFQVLQAVLSWLALDWPSRKDHVMPLLSHVRLGTLSFDKVVKVFDMFANPLKESHDYRDIYEALLKYLHDGEKRFVQSLFRECNDLFLPRTSIKVSYGP